MEILELEVGSWMLFLGLEWTFIVPGKKLWGSGNNNGSKSPAEDASVLTEAGDIVLVSVRQLFRRQAAGAPLHRPQTVQHGCPDIYPRSGLPSQKFRLDSRVTLQHAQKPIDEGIADDPPQRKLSTPWQRQAQPSASAPVR